jgi:hypothetical protein
MGAAREVLSDFAVAASHIPIEFEHSGILQDFIRAKK